MEIFLPTYIEYPPGSRAHHALSLCSLLPVCAYVSLLTILVSHRALRAFSALAGLSLSHLLNALLKPLLARPRPPPHPAALHPLASHGMPSDHAQQAAFLAAYCALLLAAAHPRRAAARPAERAAGLAACAAYAAATAASRVFARAHSPDQVLAGAALGAASAAAWLRLEGVVAGTPAARAVLQSWLVRDVLRLRYARGARDARDVRGCETKGRVADVDSPRGAEAAQCAGVGKKVK